MIFMDDEKYVRVGNYILNCRAQIDEALKGAEDLIRVGNIKEGKKVLDKAINRVGQLLEGVEAELERASL